MDFLLLVLAGFAGGVLGGLLGVGGGIIFVLILPKYLQLQGVQPAELPAFIIANSLFGIVFSSIAGLYRHYRYGSFYWREIILIGALSVVFSLATIKYVVNTPFYSKEKYDLVFYSVVVYMLLQSVANVLKENSLMNKPEPPFKNSLAWVGIFSGVISPLTGLGGGIVVVPLLKNVFHYSIKKATAISLGVVFVTALWATIYNMTFEQAPRYTEAQQGYIMFNLVLPLTVGVVGGGNVGVWLNNRLPGKYIHYAFIVFMLIVLIRRLYGGA